jgi:molybdate transport system substrate-binding protein
MTPLRALVLASLAAAAPAGAAPRAAARTVAVAAASDLRFAFDEVIAEFRKAHAAIDVTVTYGSSGNFFSQLSNGAPFDIFLSADATYPRRLMEDGLGLSDSFFLYAIGHIVLWVPKDSPLDPAGGLSALRAAAVRRVAIANPAHAPYGRAAEAALRHDGLWDAMRDRLVLGENVAQAAQFVTSGNADAGILPLSLALSPAMKDAGRYWEIPRDAYPKMEQGGLVLKWARDPGAARDLCAFVTGEKGWQILQRWGFALPGG